MISAGDAARGGGGGGESGMGRAMGRRGTGGIAPVGGRRGPSDIPARWYMGRGPKVAGIRIGGMVYAGHNMAGMAAPEVAEASLVDPRWPVEVPDEGASVPMLPHAPTYAGIGPLQRGRYLQFLASERRMADAGGDVGYAFLYLFGLERRLIVDASVPGVVPQGEREAVCGELLRLLGEFGGVSSSMRLHILSLLLYDGSLTPAEIGLGTLSRVVPLAMRGGIRGLVMKAGKYRAFQHMLLSRLIEHGDRVTATDIAAYAVLCMFDGMRSARVAEEALADGGPADAMGLVRLVARRYAKADDIPREITPRLAGGRNRLLGRRGGTPTVRYRPSSPSLCDHPERVSPSRRLRIDPHASLPMEMLGRVTAEAFDDVRTFASVAGTKPSRRAAETLSLVPDDVVLVMRTPVALKESIDPSRPMCRVRMGDLVAAAESSLSEALPARKDGSYSEAVLELTDKVLASMGWQAVTPATFSGGEPVRWRVGADDDVIAYRRGTAFSGDGKQRMADAYGPGRHTSGGYPTRVPLDADSDPDGLQADMAAKLPAAVLMGWLVARSGGVVDEASLAMMPARLMPLAATSSRAAARLTMAVAAASSLRARTPAAARRAAGMLATDDDLRMLLMSVATGLCGRVISEGVADACREAYGWRGMDADMVLYDYHAFDGGEAAGDGFSLDAGTVSRMVDDTEAVQDMVAEAIEDAEGDAEPAAEAAGGVPDAEAAIREAFGDGDELAVSELQAALVAALPHVSTAADAMQAIADANAAAAAAGGEELVEVDGPVAYLNA